MSEAGVGAALFCLKPEPTPFGRRDVSSVVEPEPDFFAGAGERAGSSLLLYEDENEEEDEDE